MAIIVEPKLIHWEYFLALEDDIFRVSRYIEFSEDNFNCYSLEFVKLLLSVCSEVDVLAKQLCRKIDSTSCADNIVEYRSKILSGFPKFADYRVRLKRFGLVLSPWTNWTNGMSPEWWTEHTGIKHRRHEKFNNATLKNVLNAYGGLFVLLLYFYKQQAEDAELSPNPKIFAAIEENVYGHTCTEDILVANYGNLD